MDPYEEIGDNLIEYTELLTPSQAAVPEESKTYDALLIEAVAGYPPLYDKQVKEYHNAEIRQNCWSMVAAVTNTPAAYCLKRWGQLRDSFTGEKRRRTNEQRSGSGATTRKGFALYNQMDFLQKHVKQKKTFTNIPPSSVKTSSAAGLQQSNVHASPQLGPAHRFPGSTSTITGLDDMLQSDILPGPVFDTEVELSSSFPPTPESNFSTPPHTSSMLTPPLEPTTATSTHPLFPQVSTSNSEALTTRPEVATSNILERSSNFSKVTCTETSVRSGSNLPALTSPPPPPPPPRTPTPRSTLPSPISPYSPYSDFSYSFSPDEVSDTTSRSSAAPTSCYTKDLRKGKKVDPVEKSFLNLSSVIQDHFAQKAVAKPPQISTGTGDVPAFNSEDAFGSLIATELKKMDEETKKQKKARIIQILYE